MTEIIPAVGRSEMDEDVIDGVVVDSAETTRPVTINLIRIYQTAQAVATHKHTKRAALHAGYIPLGAYALGYMAWKSRSTAVYDRRIAQAIAVGQQKEALQWEEAKRAWVNDRHQRRIARRESALAVAKASPYIAGGGTALLLVIGGAVAYANHNAADIILPIEVIAKAVAGVIFVITVAWGPLVLAAPWLAVVGLWHLGRRYAQRSDAPAWLKTAADADADIAIDETTIAQALKALKISQISDYLKAGHALQYIQTARQEGRGTSFSIRLPVGVTADRIARRRADVATGLYRQAKEVWLSTGGEAGILDGWIADKGALEEGAGAYPLLTEGSVNVFDGVPFGKTLRGDPVKAPMMGRNTITGGMPEQGKSSGARVIMTGAALDPTAELRIYIPDVNFDFEVMKRRCSRYVMGAEDEYIEQIRDDLRELKAEVQSRGELLVQYEVPEVTRKLASAGVGLHPLFVLLEEAHVAIQHKQYGKEISQLLIDIVKLGRKRGIHMLVSTQAPTADSMPRDVTRNCSNGIAFAVGDHVANDALLGQGAYRGGHRATDLIPGTDRGTALVKGFTGQRSEMVQVYFLSVDKGSIRGDQVTPIIDRAMAELERRGLAVPGTDRKRVIDSRDLLADIDAVVGDGRVNLADVPVLLKREAPTWEPYQSLTGVQLRKLLEADGVRVLTTGGYLWLEPADLRSVLASR